MPKLIIDNIPVEVPEGTSVLEAAQSVDIPIPHFCWHPALGKAGACRVCAVKMVDGPVKGIQMSCMLPVQDGMVVSTNDPEAMAMRRHVLEWLMINHPHDCPVCDEGGECQLQDYTIAGGHGIRRYTGPKRTHTNQYLGPYIQHEMNRCIQCYRCARFYQEYAGGTDFGALGSAQKVYFGRFRDGQLHSPFSGNLVDICPTGVFTDSTARFRARYWDYDMTPSICQGCSLGCNVTPAARYRELLKIIARPNRAVNGWFICDQGRFSPATEVNHPQRPRIPLVDGRETTWDEALDALELRIKEVKEQYGPGSIAVVGSTRLSLEAAVLLPRVAEITKAGAVCYFYDEADAGRSTAAVTHRSAANAVSMAELAQADCIALVDVDLLAEGPMMALAVRQAWRQGASIFLVGGQAPLAQAQTVGIKAMRVDSWEDISFSTFKKPVVICGTRHNSPETIEQFMQSGVGTVCLLSGPNTFGCALLAREHEAVTLAQALAHGKIQAVIAVEADIPAQLLEAIAFVAVLDWRHTETVASARIVLPTTAWVEMDGTCINNEGRAQRFKKVMQSGLPIKGLDPAGHPSHSHRSTVPGGEARPAWRIMAELIARHGGGEIIEPLSGRWEKLRQLDAEGEGVLVHDQ
jgi:NADH-quinone oxidoreductase subunit G